MKQKMIAVIAALSMMCGGAHIAGAAQPNSSDAERTRAMEKIEKAYELISNEYVENVDKEKLLEGAIQGMLSTLNDPYSVYMDKQTAKQFSDSLDSSFEGIGAEVGMKDNKIIIVSPFKQSPAEKAGLKPNDEIISINGVSMNGKDLNEAVLKIRGKKDRRFLLKYSVRVLKNSCHSGLKERKSRLKPYLLPAKNQAVIMSATSAYRHFPSIPPRTSPRR